MIRLLCVICSATIIFSASSSLAKQEPKDANTNAEKRTTATNGHKNGAKPGESMAKDGTNKCKACHTCDTPTAESVCLPTCAREGRKERHDFLPDYRGPDVIILDELEDDYLPVPFDHKGHATMAEMTQGCVACHHYTPEGRRHPACKTCHDPKVTGTGIEKPGLKGAYHRQCLNCHRDWIDETDCVICHRLKAGKTGAGSEAQPTDTEILGSMHPPITEPTTQIYRTETKESGKSIVMFRHWEHVQSFDLGCVDCHHEESCTRCHIPEGGRKIKKTLKDHHELCVRCHEADMPEGKKELDGGCRRCHWQEGHPKPKPFDHDSTGWPLNTYHESNSCRDCHKQVPFVKMPTECNSCHADWDPDSFDHSVTGQVLDETHEEIDCEDCHADRKYNQKPSCSECHDPDDDGIEFPKSRPGKLVGIRAPRGNPNAVGPARASQPAQEEGVK